MRKNFLILMLLTLLPLAGFAANPAAKAGLIYNKSAQALIDAGTEDGTYYYAVVNGGADRPAASAFSTTVPSKTNAGTYDVYYVLKAEAGDVTSAEALAATKVVTSIAKAGTITVTAKNPSMVYGGAEPGITDFYQAEGWLAGESAATTGHPVALPQNFDVTSAGNRQFTLQAIELTNYNVSITQPTGNLSIAQKALTVTTNPVEAITYGTQKPSFTVENYSASIKAGDQLGSITGYIVKIHNAETVVEGDILPAGQYDVYATGLSNSNYSITYEPALLVVNQKELAATMITDIATVTYDGNNHKPTVTVSDGTLLSEDDYTVSFKFGDDDIEEANYNTGFINAGTYTVTLTAAGTNYKDPDTKAHKDFIIDRKPVQLRTKGDALTYSKQHYDDGNNETTTDYVLTTDDHLQWTGVLNGDLQDNMLKDAILNGATFTLALYDGEDVVAANAVLNAGTYTVKAVVGGNGLAAIKNYNVTVGNIGQIVVAKKNVSITPKSVSYNYGTNDSKKFQTATNATAGDLWIGTTVKNAQGEITGVTDGTGLAGDDAFATVIGENNITLSRPTGLNADDYILTATVPTNAEYGNYVFTAAETGIFKIKAIGGVQIWANDANSTYKGARADLSAIIFGVDNVPTEVQTAVNNAMTVNFGEGKTASTANAGEYTISFNEEALTTALAGLENYDLDDLETYTGTYTINRAELTVYPAAQVHMAGEALEVASNNNISFEETAPEGADLIAIATALTFEYNLVGDYLTDGKPNETAASHGKSATAVDTHDGVYVDGIQITEASINAYNAAQNNYTLIAKKGQLTVTSAAVVEFDAKAADNSEDIEAQAGRKLNVQIKNRKLYANQWNAIVLPFAITPFEFCKAIDTYAVFDVLQTSGEAMNFKISLETIPAYMPFLVKVDKQIDLTTVTFNKVTIEEVNEEMLTQSNDAYNFIGTLDKKDYAGPLWFTQPNEPNGKINLQYKPNGQNLPGFYAYFTSKTGSNEAPVIFIEEPDGNTTAISTISADGVAMKADGWYNLNGVKLQGVPTEKGVYINNGKKVVIK